VHPEPHHVFTPQIANQQAVGNTHNSYANTSQSLHTPIFETQEDADYHMATSSSSSIHSDCITPREKEGIMIFNEEVAVTKKRDGSGKH